MSSVPSTASMSVPRSQTAGEMQRQGELITRKSVSSRAMNKNASSHTVHRSVPPVHELTSHNIGYKPNSNYVRYQRTAPAPTNMTYLPSAQEKLLQNRKLLAKVVGLDATHFDQTAFGGKSASRVNSSQSYNEDINSPRYSNAFWSARSPRGLRSSKEYEMSQSEILKGHGLPATARLLRGGDSKYYGIRRQISANNQLELSPDFAAEARKSAIHFNTPAGDQSQLITPADDEKLESPTRDDDGKPSGKLSQESYHASNLVSPFGPNEIDETKTALTNSLVSRDRNRDAPWVYCYKVKRDRMKLSKLLTSKSSTDPAIDELLPAF